MVAPVGEPPRHSGTRVPVAAAERDQQDARHDGQDAGTATAPGRWPEHGDRDGEGEQWPGAACQGVDQVEVPLGVPALQDELVDDVQARRDRRGTGPRSTSARSPATTTQSTPIGTQIAAETTTYSQMKATREEPTPLAARFQVACRSAAARTSARAAPLKRDRRPGRATSGSRPGRCRAPACGRRRRRTRGAGRRPAARALPSSTQRYAARSPTACSSRAAPRPVPCARASTLIA